jgi:amino acid exporter
MSEMSAYLPGIALAYSAFLLSITSPGPNVLAILGTSMSTGRRQGVALGLGVAAGSFCWAMLTATGLSAVVASTAIALTAIKIAGGLYLLWLAYRAFLSAASARELATTTISNVPMTLRGYFRRGLVVQMTNPKAALAWVAIISLGLNADAPHWVAAVIVIGTTSLSVIVHTLYALAFSTSPMIRIYSRSRRYIQAILGAFFAFAGVKLLASRL